MSFEKLIIEAIKESIGKGEDKSNVAKKAKEIRLAFEDKFSHLNFKYWKIIYRVKDDEEREDWAPAFKVNDEWDARGISTWAKFALMNKAPILTSYEGVEDFLSTLSDGWIFVGEKDDDLIILSNYPNRCGLIKVI